MNDLLLTIAVGIGATAFMDIWTLVRRSLLAIPAPDYGLVGRWMAYMPLGQFRHDAIAKAAPRPGERIVGWTAHYLIGIVYAFLLIGIQGDDWLRQPTFWPALLVGLVTVLAPFLLMQPGMGAGIAASRTPDPRMARIHTLTNHAMFGTGLFVSAWFLQLVIGPAG